MKVGETSFLISEKSWIMKHFSFIIRDFLSSIISDFLSSIISDLSSFVIYKNVKFFFLYKLKNFSFSLLKQKNSTDFRYTAKTNTEFIVLKEKILKKKKAGSQNLHNINI